MISSKVLPRMPGSTLHLELRTALTEIELSPAWISAFPGAHAGFLILRQVANPERHPLLEQSKLALQASLRRQYAGYDHRDIAGLPVIQAYANHYRRFKKTYHVQSQLESIVFREQGFPSVAALVEAMFMAEVKNLLLTAGHDLDEVELPIRLGVSGGSEVYTTLRGQEQVLKSGDMFIADQAGVISDVIYGPDQRTRIHSATQNALFCTYAPAGIPPGAVQAHLEDIVDYVRLFAPQADLALIQVIP